MFVAVGFEMQRQTLKTNREGTVSARKNFVRPKDEDGRVSRMI